MPAGKHCPRCQADIPPEPVEVCPFCGANLWPVLGGSPVPLIVADTMSHGILIRSILFGSRIPTWIPDENARRLWGMRVEGLELDGVPLVVPEYMLGKARDVLCMHGIACQVTPGEVEDLIRDRVDPALAKGEGGAESLVPVLAANKKEVVSRIIEDLAGRGEEGAAFVRAVLLEACRQEKTVLARSIARTLDRLGDAGLADWLASAPDAVTRARAASALAALGRHHEKAVRVLVGLLEDESIDVRGEAIEGLFSLEGEDYGYEPDAPLEERRRAVARWREQIGD